MRKILLLFLLIAICGLSGAKAQTIPNGDFETWANPAAPDGWTLVNGKAERYAEFVNGTDSVKAYSGNFFLGLRTDTMNNGQFYRGTLYSGFTFTERPLMFRSYVMYIQGEPTVPESFGVSVLLSRWDTATNQRDTVAYNNREISGTGTNGTIYPWTLVEDTLDYTSTTGTPDSAHIFIFSTRATTVSINTWLFVDKMEFANSSAGIAEKPAGNLQSATIYPNPADEFAKLGINLQKPSNINIRILDVTGREIKSVYNGKMTAGVNTIDVNLADLKQGVYFYQITEGSSVSMKKFVISR